jgi:hypothetical protein
MANPSRSAIEITLSASSRDQAYSPPNAKALRNIELGMNDTKLDIESLPSVTVWALVVSLGLKSTPAPKISSYRPEGQ